MEISSQSIYALRGPKRIKVWEIIHSWQLYACTNFEASLKIWQIFCHMLTPHNNKTTKQNQPMPTQMNLWQVEAQHRFRECLP